jgi:hypothetical protein
MSTIDRISNPNFYQLDELSGIAYNVLIEPERMFLIRKKEKLFFLKTLLRQTIIQREGKYYI